MDDQVLLWFAEQYEGILNTFLRNTKFQKYANRALSNDHEMYLTHPAVLRVHLAWILYGYKHFSKINQIKL